MDPEFLKALELVAEYDRQRPIIVIEYRLYYADDGSIIGLCESNHPADTNYIVLDSPDVFNKNNTATLKVVNGKLTIIDLTHPLKNGIEKTLSGQPVVAGHAALALNIDEQYSNIEYYGRKTNH